MEKTISANKMRFNDELSKMMDIERIKFEKREENIKMEAKQATPVIKSEKIPHIGSKYRSGVYNSNIDMRISDEFECLPEYFQKVIPKTHP